MLHARVLRPARSARPLLSVDDSAARKVDGFVRTVRKGDFLAVLAKTEWGAVKAMRARRRPSGAPPSRCPSRPPCSTTGAASSWPRRT
jgi:hypothetical protein